MVQNQCGNNSSDPLDTVADAMEAAFEILSFEPWQVAMLVALFIVVLASRLCG